MGDGLWFIVHEFLLFMGYLFFWRGSPEVGKSGSPKVLKSSEVLRVFSSSEFFDFRAHVIARFFSFPTS
jgi:hypothetical protein